MSSTGERSFDVVVVGAGPGGYVAAIRAAQLGRSVAVVEEKYWGGVCLNVGCVPSKSLLKNAELTYAVTRDGARFGLSGDVRADYGVAHTRSREVAAGRSKGVHFLMRKNGITELNGHARFSSRSRLDVIGDDGSTTVAFDTAIIATGARPRMIAGVGKSQHVLTYEELILADSVPPSLIVVGAGAIGVELGYLMNAYGCKVTIVEHADRILPSEDKDISRVVTKAFTKQGIEVITGAKVDSITDDAEVTTVTWTGADDTTHRKSAAAILVATGFIPNTEDIGLDMAGVAIDHHGAIVVDERMRTTQPTIFAIGDVTMKLALAHVAEAQGVVAAETIAGVVTMELGDYRMMPRATFAHPQVASFGLTEEQARSEEGGTIKVATFPYSANGKAHGLGDATGLVKLIAKQTGELLGAHLVGAEVTELLPELTLAQKWDLGSFELARNIHVHPTMGEALQEAFHGLEGYMINL